MCFRHWLAIMPTGKYETLWQLMKRNDFILINNISDEYKCTICRKILINACNSPCGCRFCSHCINHYLRLSDSHCPGELESCKEELINFDKDIQIDRAINTRITKLLAKCPEESCDFQDELRKIEDHLRVCEVRTTKCPYFHIGCVEEIMPSINIDKHMQESNISHIKQLMDCINNLRSEMGAMKSEIKALKMDQEHKQVRFCDKLILNHLSLLE